MTKYFADLSNNNGPAVRVDEIDADAVILKASEGSSFTDGYRATWQAGLEARGIPCGTYHFHRGAATPAAQLARWIADGLDTGALRPVLDCEDTSKTIGPDAMAANCLELAELVANHCGVAPIIYTGGWWLGTYATRDPAWARYDLWLSAYPLGYNRQPSDAEAATWLAAGRYCAPPTPWAEVAAWQYTSIAAQAGVPGNSDRSIVTDDAFARMFRTNPAQGEDDMPTAAEVAEAVMQRLNTEGAGPGTLGFGQTITRMDQNLAVLINRGGAAAIDPHALADAIVAAGIGDAVAKALAAKLNAPAA